MPQQPIFSTGPFLSTGPFETSRVLVMILAGGEGRRLGPLTNERAKPAVPFGGRYRIIDMVLSNFVNSGLRQIKVLTQYKSASLEEHVARATCSSSEALLYWVRTLIWRSPELTKLESTMSMIRYRPPKGTAGLARSLVSGPSRRPSPP